MRDVIVIGGGVAGMQAAIYLSSENRSVTLLESSRRLGGQIRRSPMIENVLGHIHITGKRLAFHTAVQLDNFGTDVRLGIRATRIRRYHNHVSVDCDNGETLEAKTVVIATGLQFRPIDFIGNKNRRVKWGPFYEDVRNVKRPCVVGGGNGAAQFALSLLDKVEHVSMVTRSPIETRMSAYLIDRIRESTIELMEDAVPTEFTSDILILSDGRMLSADRVYCFVGETFVPIPIEDCRRSREPIAQIHPNGYDHNDLAIDRDSEGVARIFVCGDARFDSMKRVAAAMGDGARTASLVNRTLNA